MSHTFLSLDMDLIPQATKDNVPTFLSGVFSNDGKRLLIDGYNDKRELVHRQETFNKWLQWSDNPLLVQQDLLSTSIEYTKDEFTAEKNNPSSIWHVNIKGFN